jgi:glycosyltransferase involved in cell wall biosynthesis/phosphoheptose isomerase
VRIALISEHASPLAALGGVDAGGQNVHVAALARGLAARGHDVDVYTRREDREVAERVPLAPGATVVHVPAGPPEVLSKDELLPFMDDFGDWVAADWAVRGRPQVVHGHFWMSGLAALRAGRSAGVPVAQTFHALGTVKRRFQGAADTSPPERLELERGVAAEVDLVIATCTDEVAELRRMDVPTGRVRVIPCGVDTEHFSPGPPAAVQRVSERRPRLLLVGRMVERKGFDTAVRALAELPDAELVIAGGPPAPLLDDDPEARRLRAVARSVGVEDRVLMLGQVAHADMPDIYRSVDVVLATPWYEPFGITPLEAAACARPLVGSAVGGLLDSVVDGLTGRLVPARDPAALSQAVAELLADPAKAARWGHSARERAVERFDWGVVAAQTEQALAEVAASAAARAGKGQPMPATTTGAQVRQLSTGDWLGQHAAELQSGMDSLLRDSELIESWGERLAASLTGGSRLMAAGNGGSAAEAQHLTAELVGRFKGERRPLSAISLHAETSSLTAILNDYGPDEVFARQVEAHGRPGDVLVLLSTSGSSSNVLHAAKRAHELGLQVWALTGPAPNPLASVADEAVAVSAGSTAAVQEVHLVAVHALCAALDAALERAAR